MGLRNRKWEDFSDLKGLQTRGLCNLPIISSVNRSLATYMLMHPIGSRPVSKSRSLGSDIPLLRADKLARGTVSFDTAEDCAND